MTEEIDQNYVRSQQVLNGKEITNFKTKKVRIFISMRSAIEINF
jgi:hypothetical protein